MPTKTSALKKATLEALKELPEERLAEVLDFVMFLKQREGNQIGKLIVKSVPVHSLGPLIGIVSVGGNAVEDAERIWDDSAA